MCPEKSRSVLWITGIDSLLKNYEGESYDFNEFYEEIIEALPSLTGYEKCTKGHFIFGKDDEKTAVVFSTSYKVWDMRHDFEVLGVRRIIFLRPPHNTTQRTFIAEAQHLGASFMSQQIPKVYPPLQQADRDEKEFIAFNLYSPKTRLTEKGKSILEKVGNAAKKLLYDIIVDLLSKIIMGQCTYMNH